ncbi:MAG: transcription termination factor Rho [Planctomycetota bacterium]
MPDSAAATDGDAPAKKKKKAARKAKARKKAVKKASSRSSAKAAEEEVVESTDEAPPKKAPAKKASKASRKKKAAPRKAKAEDDAPVEAAAPDRSAPAQSAQDQSTPGQSTPGESAPEPAPASEKAAESRAEVNGHASADAAGEGSSGEGGPGEGRKRRTRRGRRRRRSGAAEDGATGDETRDDATGSSEPGTATAESGTADGEGGGRSRRRRRRRGKRQGDGQGDGPRHDKGGPDVHDRPKRQRGKGGDQDRTDAGPRIGTGMFILDKGNVSVLRRKEAGYLPTKDDIYVPKKLVQKHKLRDGMMITGPLSRGYKHKHQLDAIDEIDGQEPKTWSNKPVFKNLTSVDPDFHYAVGDITDDVSMRVIDLISPIGRGQRGLLVAPPRTGKTTLLRQFAAGIEKGYPDVHLMVLLVDERPEEATEWTRSVERGEVFVSTADETSKHHIQVAELAWKRAMRLVEMGEDVVMLLDSITRLARAYNNQAGSGRTMSGGLDSRAMERPRKLFGSARNTVEAGSLTILGTTLVETGSRMDQLVFEEFKGTGNMELVLNRKLADRRIFPAIDIEKSGTRKEEKLVGMRRLKLIHVLRRVLARMHFAEAAELLITRLDDVEKTDDFLERFTVDPEA